MSCDPTKCPKCGVLHNDFTPAAHCASCWSAMPRHERRRIEKAQHKEFERWLREERKRPEVGA